jgi:hypothetical protein
LSIFYFLQQEPTYSCFIAFTGFESDALIVSHAVVSNAMHIRTTTGVANCHQVSGTLKEHTFNPVNIISVVVHAIVTFFKTNISTDNNKCGNSQCKPDDINGSIKPVLDEITPGNLYDVSDH